jgi:septum formation inhibitor MinC
MESWPNWLLPFAAGIGVGIALVAVKPLLFAAKKRRTDLVEARSRILAGIKEKHEEEILDEAFRTTEAIKGELDKSLQTLRRTLNAVMDPPAAEAPPQEPLIQLSHPIKSGQSAT